MDLLAQQRKNKNRGKLRGGDANISKGRRGFVVASAEGARFSYSELPLPKPPIDERAAALAQEAGSTLVRAEIDPELAGAWSCFDETLADGSITGRIWVMRQPVDQTSREDL